MKLHHTGHEVYKCARVAGDTKKFGFQWFNSCYRPFVFHLCKILYNFLVCNVLSLNSENRSSGPETGQQKINALADN